MSTANGEWTPAREEVRAMGKRVMSEHFARTKKIRESRRKITLEQREEVVRRARDGECVRALSLEFGITAQYVRTLKREGTWGE